MRLAIEQDALHVGTSITLSAGKDSTFYFDCKRVMLNGRFLSMFTDYVFQHVMPKINPMPDVIGGLTMGADFMTAALVMKSAQINMPIIHGSIVRKEPKAHGMSKMIENAPPKGKRVLAVDDVITSGKSVIKACIEFQNEGLTIVGILCLIDRKQGGRENIQKAIGKVPIYSIFSINDFSSLQQNVI